MAACATCGKPIEDEVATGVVCAACLRASQASDDAARNTLLSRLPLAVIIGLVPFVFHYRIVDTTTETVNGVSRTVEHVVDYAPALCGPVAIFFGALALGKARTSPEEFRRRNYGMALFGVALGVFHVIRAFA